MNCPKCGHENRNDALFCLDCGVPLRSKVPRNCFRCGAKNPSDAKFCEKCGLLLEISNLQKATCTLSKANLMHNLAVIKAEAPGVQIMAIVKANAYGHGIISVSQILEGNVGALGVASIYEAMVLRQAGIKSSITLLEGVSEPEELSLASKQNFSVVFHSDHQIRLLEEIKPLSNKLHAWLKFNTGMGRLGFSPETVVQAMKALSKNSSILQPVGIMSHFACSNESTDLNDKQISVFCDFAQTHNGEKSFCNSAAIFDFSEMHYDWVRPGLVLYGVSPFAKRSASSLGLKPVMTFHTKLIAVQKFKRGDNVGYCPQFTCPEDMPVGIAAVGYSDGYPLATKKGGLVLINGVPCPLIGQVMMDMTAVDLRPCAKAKVGYKVTLWGDGLPIEDVAKFSRISYALLTGIHDNRVRFEWK